MLEQRVVTAYQKYFPQAVFLGVASDPYEAYKAGRAVHHTDPAELAKWAARHRIPERVEFSHQTGYHHLPVFRVQLGGRTEGEHQTTIPILEHDLTGTYS